MRPSPKAKKLSYKEQQEYDGMEAAILAAEQSTRHGQAAVDSRRPPGHAVLAEACRAMEEAQRTVERLYARWAELEARRST